MEERGIYLQVEPPLPLSHDAHQAREMARRKAQLFTTLAGIDNENHEAGPSAITKDLIDLDVLQRAYVDPSTSIQAEQLPMSIRLQKLWAERGDFSRFRPSDLLARIEDEDDEEEQKRLAKQSEVDCGALIDDLIEEEDATKADERNGIVEGDKSKESNGTDKEKGDVMSIEEMRQVRRDMMDKLGMAQNSMYFSHALVSLLLNSTKPTHDAPPMHAGSAGSTRLAAEANGGGSITRSNTGAQMLGSAASLEAELGIEPHVFGASRIDAVRRDVERRAEDEDEDQKSNADDGDDDNDDEDPEKARATIERQDARLLDEEVEGHALDLVQRLEGKRQGLQAAVSILRKGAQTIHPDNEGAGRDRVRWQALMYARRAGWGLTPDKPERGTAEKRRELLQDLGMSANRKDEAARDAWIGYAVPEAGSRYVRRALAYLSHSSTDGDRPVDALLFASRSHKVLRLEVVVDQEVWRSTTSKEGRTTPDTIDAMLQEAQAELMDEELFDSILAEARILSLASLSHVTVDNEDQVTIGLNRRTSLRFVREARQHNDMETTSPSEASTAYTSPLLTSMLAMLRLSLLRRYRQRAGLGADQETAKVEQTEKESEHDSVQAPLLQPLLGLIHYASFSAHLYVVLTALVQRHTSLQLQMDAFERLSGMSTWLVNLLQQGGATDSMAAVRRLGGSATILQGNRPLAFITFAYPSHASLSLPLRPVNDGTDKGVYLPSIDLASLDSILQKEVLRVTTTA